MGKKRGICGGKTDVVQSLPILRMTISTLRKSDFLERRENKVRKDDKCQKQK
jgi:hypothetical protein